MQFFEVKYPSEMKMSTASEASTDSAPRPSLRSGAQESKGAGGKMDQQSSVFGCALLAERA